MKRVCVKAKRGSSGSCVCDHYEDANTAYSRYHSVRSDDPRVANRNHPDYDPTLRTFRTLCHAAGLTNYNVGKINLQERGTPIGEQQMAKMHMGDLPPIEEYSGFAAATDFVRDLIPSKEHLVNMVKAGGGVVGAFLIADQLIPRIPWLSGQSIYVKAGAKFALAAVAGPLVAKKVDGYLGGGFAAGLVASAAYDMLDEFVFKGKLLGGSATEVVPVATKKPGETNGYSDAATQLFGDGNEERMFAALSDVSVMRPDELSGDSTVDVDIMSQGGPIYDSQDGSEGEMEGVGSFLQ